MDFKKFFYPESRFGGFTDIDGTIIFYTRVNSLIQASSILLDIGCGRGAHAEDPISIRRDLQIFKGKCERVIGLDVDESGAQNPFIDEFRLIKDDRWPVENESIDLAISDSVLEHVENPDLFFSECERVIKPGGFLCIRTGNLLGYVCLLANFIPNKLHNTILAKLMTNRKETDTFPTLYRCNTVRALRKMVHKYNFDSCVYGHEPEPGYMSFSLISYILGVLYGKLAPGMLKVTIFAFAKKR